MSFVPAPAGSGPTIRKLGNEASAGTFDGVISHSLSPRESSPVGYCTAVDSHNGGNGGGYIACLDFKTVEVSWNERDPDKRRLRKCSMIQADYRTEDGPIVPIEPNRKEYIVRGRFKQPERTSKPAWAHPVIANGKLYIRAQDTLFCYDVNAGGK